MLAREARFSLVKPLMSGGNSNPELHQLGLYCSGIPDTG